MTKEQLNTIARVVSSAQIRAVRLVDMSARTRVQAASEIPDESDIEISHGAHVDGELQEDGTFIVHAIVNMEVESDVKAEPFVSVRAVFELKYRLPPEIKASAEELETFANVNAVFNAWPYFREFIQATIARMNLPPFVLPLFRMPKAKGAAALEAEKKSSVKTRRKGGR